MPMVSTQTQERSMLYMPCQHQQASQNSKEFLGLVMYLHPFIPGLSSLTAPLCELLKKDADFLWNQPMMPLYSRSRKLLSATPPSGISTLTTGDNTSWCLTGRLWCSTPTNWQTHSFCQQGPYQHQMLICKLRERDVSCHLWSREILNICLW